MPEPAMDGAQAQGGAATPDSCELAELDLRLHAQGALPAERAQRLRAHLVQCASCAAEFRSAVEQRARLGRAVRGGPEVAGQGQRSSPAPSTPVLAMEDDLEDARPPRPTAAAKRQRRFRLRTLVIPAFFTWLILQIAGAGAKPGRLEVSEARGNVTIAERPYTDYERTPLLIRGAWCNTDEASSATLVAPGARVVVGSWSSVQAEATEPLRLRLRAGELDLEGTATIVTNLGVVDLVSGAGHMRLSAEGVQLECRAGSLVFVGPLGERRLVAGERALLGR